MQEDKTISFNKWSWTSLSENVGESTSGNHASIDRDFIWFTSVAYLFDVAVSISEEKDKNWTGKAVERKKHSSIY